MERIVKIAIKGSSGYCSIDGAYCDEVLLTRGSIGYSYEPERPCEMHPSRKWLYESSSPLFESLYDEACVQAMKIVENPIDKDCTDLGIVELVFEFEDGTRFERSLFAEHECFSDLFAPVKALVPKTEFIPSVLLVGDDYKNDRGRVAPYDPWAHFGDGF